MLYMDDRYDLELYERQRRLLLEWHRDDPVDEPERWRNRRIIEVQGEAESLDRVDGPARQENRARGPVQPASGSLLGVES